MNQERNHPVVISDTPESEVPTLPSSRSEAPTPPSSRSGVPSLPSIPSTQRSTALEHETNVVVPRLPRKRMLSKPLIPSISRYLKTLNPTVQRALTKCALAQPDDPALWLANFFLRASPASDNYSLRKNNSVYLTHKDGAGVSTPPASSQTAALTAGDTTAIANATRA